MKPLGLVFILLMVYAHATLKVYARWVAREAAAQIQKDGRAPACTQRGATHATVHM